MRQPLLYIFSLLATLSLVGQDTLSIDSPDTTLFSKQIIDSSLVEDRMIRPYIIIDYGKLGATLATNETKYEFGGGLLLFNAIHLAGSYGRGELEPSRGIANGSYTSTGTYWRLGGGVLKQFKPEAKIGIALFYGSSSFNDQGNYSILTTSTGETFKDDFERNNLSGNWYEVVVSSESWLRLRKARPESKLNSLFALGFDLRWRKLISYDQFSPIDVHSVPGYGSVLNDNTLALNIYIKVYPF